MIELIKKYITDKYISKVKEFYIDVKWKINDFKRTIIETIIKFFKGLI